MRSQAPEPRSILAILTLCVLVLPAVPAAFAQEGLSEGATETTASAETTDKTGPRVEVPDPMKDFGKVSKGQTIEHAYEIRNTGDEDLEITHVIPACGCTVAEYDKVIRPGETGQVHAEINTNLLGERSKRYITVYTNDPKRPAVQLLYDVMVIPQLGIHPGYARYRTVHGEDEPGILRQWVFALDGSDFKVTGVESPLPYLDVSFHKASAEERHPQVSERAPDSEQWVVRLELDYNAAPVGPIAQQVLVHTDHSTQKDLIIPVSGFVRPAMWATPHEIDVGEIQAGQPIRFSVVVKSFLTEPMEITGVEFGGEEVESTVSEVEEGREYTVWITVEPEPGPLRGKVRIHTSHPKNPVVEVPLRGRVL